MSQLEGQKGNINNNKTKSPLPPPKCPRTSNAFSIFNIKTKKAANDPPTGRNSDRIQCTPI